VGFFDDLWVDDVDMGHAGIAAGALELDEFSHTDAGGLDLIEVDDSVATGTRFGGIIHFTNPNSARLCSITSLSR